MTDLPALTHDTGSGVFRVTLDEDTVGLTVEGKPRLDEWVAYGNGIKRVGEVWGYVWGDFLNAFEKEFGNLWYQFVDASDYVKGTSLNYKRVTRVFPPDKRRLGRVDISHLVRLSWDTYTDEDREMYLDRVEEEGMTSNELNQLLSPKPEAIEFEGYIEGSVDLRLDYIAVPPGTPFGKYKVKLTPITTSPPE